MPIESSLGLPAGCCVFLSEYSEAECRLKEEPTILTIESSSSQNTVRRSADCLKLSAPGYQLSEDRESCGLRLGSGRKISLAKNWILYWGS